MSRLPDRSHLSQRIAQLLPQNLPRRISWYMRHEAHFTRLFVVSETFAYEAAEFVGDPVVAVVAVAKNDECTGNLTCHQILTSNNAAIADHRMLQQHRLDLRWGDGKAFVLDHLLYAINDAVVAVGVDGSHIA